MPKLPSGLQLAISRDALFDHGGNWFSCPDGHFWFWVPAPEMGSPPYELEAEIMQKATHAPIPRNREEAKKYLRVLEMRSDGQYSWRGEWLFEFPRYTELKERDLAAWNEWLAGPEIDRFLEATIEECRRLAEVSKSAQGYAVLQGANSRADNSEPGGWIKGLLRTDSSKEPAMHDIEMHEAPEEFIRCWQAAGRHIQAQVQGPLSWLRAHCNPPFLEHLSFRLGNQLFFVRIEDADGRLEVPGSRDDLQAVAEGCNGHACLMPMRGRAGAWRPDLPGWGLLDAWTGRPIDPMSLLSDERIEMTEWELLYFAIQIVRDDLEKAGRKLMTWTSHPGVNPSIWFVGDSGLEWVVVRAVRYPQMEAKPPEDWQQIAERCTRLGKVGHFASVSAANADDAFDPSGSVPAMPLWRGHRMLARFEGLVPGPIQST